MMTNSYDSLCKAKNSLHDTEHVMNCLRAFEADVKSGGIPLDELERCLAVIREIGSLSQSACAGVEAARKLISEAFRVHESLEIYDSDGRKSVKLSTNITRSRF